MSIDYNSPLHIQWNVDEEGNVTTEEILNEQIVVSENKAYLKQIPEKYFRINVTGMVEIDIDEEIKVENKFKCDYRTGALYFHHSKEGQTITVEKYNGRGVIMYPASRVYTSVEGGNVVETLGDILEQSTDAIAAYGGIVQAIADAETKKTVLNSKIAEADTSKNNLDESVLNANTINSDLSTLIPTANTTKTNLENSDTAAQLTKSQLNTSISNANTSKTDLANINTTAQTTKSQLDISIDNASSLKTDLNESISTATTQKTDLDTSISSAETKKIELDTSITNVGNKKDELDNSITTANTTKTALDQSIADGNVKNPIYSTPKTTQQPITSFDSDTKDAKVLYEIEGQSGNQITKNGDFANGIAEWGCLYATLTTNNNILNITANGTATRGRASQSLLFPLGHRVFYRAKVKVTSSECTSIQIGNSGWESLTIINNPIQNKIYTIYGAKVTDGNTTLVLDHYYADSTTSNGKIMEVMGGENGVMCIDMGTDASHPLYNKTADEMNAMFPTYFEGVGHSTVDLQTESKNLLNLNSIKIGEYSMLDGEIIDEEEKTTSLTITDTGAEFETTSNFNGIRLDDIYYFDDKLYYQSTNTNFNRLLINIVDSNGNFIEHLGSYTDTEASSGITIGGKFVKLSIVNTGGYSKLENMMLSDKPITPYQPHKSKTLQPNITLRSVPAISDKLRNAVLVDGKLKALECAEHVKNVSDEAVLNGNENWVYSADLGTVYRMGLGSTEYGTNIKGGSSRLIIDGEEVVMNLGYDLNSEHHYISGATKSLYLFILKSKVDVQTGPTTIEKFKTYLSQYPITLNYQLENPPITKLPNLPELWSYANGRLIDNSPIKPKITYSVAQNNVAQTQGNTEVLQKHEDQIESNMNEIGILKDEITNNINQETATLTNANPTEHITAKQNGGMDVEVGGTMVVNLFGREGDCEDISNLKSSGYASIALDDTVNNTGNNSIKATVTSLSSNAYARTLNKEIDNTKNHFARVWVKNSLNSESITLRCVKNSGAGTVPNCVISSAIGVGNSGNIGIKINKADLSDVTNLSIDIVTSLIEPSTGGTFNIDSVMLIEVSDNEYNNLTVDQLLAKYPYVNGAQPLLHPMVEVCGKNLVDEHKLANAIGTVGSVTTSFVDGKIYYNQTDTTDSRSGYLYIPVNGNNQYTFEFKNFELIYGHGVAYGMIMECDKDLNTIGSPNFFHIYASLSSDCTITTDSSTRYLRVYITSQGQTSITEYKVNMIASKGSAIGSYEPYQGDKGGQIIFPTELAKIDTYQDKLTYKDGVAKVDREVKHVVLDGRLDWGDGTDLGTVYRFSVVKPSVDIQDMVNTDMLIINGQRITYLGSYTSDTEHWYANGYLLLYIEKPQIDIQSGATVIEKFKSYLNAFPAEVYYVLQEPIQEEIQPIILGDGVNLVEGQNTLTVKSGVVWERATHVKVGDYYYINRSYTDDINSALSYKVGSIKEIYRIKDGSRVNDTSNWTIENHTFAAYGNQRAYIESSIFELEERRDSEYYVLYEVLQEDYNCQVQEVEVSYEDSIRGVVNETVEMVANNEQAIGNLWTALMPLADKELTMASVESLQGDVTLTDVINKINEILNGWKG